MTKLKDSIITDKMSSGKSLHTDETNSSFIVFLIGEDDVELLRLWDMLDEAGNSNYDTKIINSYESALSQAAQAHPDLCLIDFSMTERNGFDFVQALKDAQIDVPAIFLMDEENEDIIVSAIDAGIDNCLVKGSITPLELKKSIKYAIGRYRKMNCPEKYSLNQNEAIYETLVENANDAIVLLQDGVAVSCNSKTLELFKCEREQILNKKPIDYSPEIQPDGRRSIEAALEKYNLALNGVPQVFEWMHLRQDKTEFDANVSLNSVRLAGKTYVMTIIRDITQYKVAERMLRENEEKFRNIYNNAQVGMFKSRVSDGAVLQCNDRFAQIFGFKYAEEILEKSATNQNQYVDEGTRESMLAELKTMGEVKNFEARFKCADGQIKWIRYSAHLNAEQDYMEGIAADITLEKRAFNMLRKSNQKVRNILESISDGFYTLDSNLGITFFNRAAEKILGRKGSEVLGMNLFMVLPEFRGEELEKEFRQVLRSKKVSSIELNLDAKADSEWYEIRIYPSEDGLSVYFREITARKRFEQMLLDKERKMQSILSTAAEGILIVDKNGLIESYNPAAKHIFGYDQQILKNEKITTLIPNFLVKITKLLNIANEPKGRRFSNFELNGKRQDNSSFPLKLSVSEMNLNGQKWYTVIAHDLTEEREHMSQLIEMDRFSAIGTLAAGVAHEFKNYLAGIIGNASYGLEYLDRQDGLTLARDTLEQILNIGENANRVALSLLTYSRNNLDEKTREDLNALIDEVLMIILKEARASNVEIETHFEDIPKLCVFAGRFQQMVLNLVLNAKQAIETKGIITVSTFLQDDQIVIEVKDNGRGIPEENLNRIFDPFFSTKGVWGPHKDNGAGLGLSICRNITLEHNGDISVNSSVASGTTFTIKLPVQHGITKQLTNTFDIDNQNIVLFSSDYNTILFFKECSEKAKTELYVCKNINELDDICREQLLVVLDADYPGMGELYRIGQYCKEKNIKFAIVNSGKYVEHQLEELFTDASIVIKGLPDQKSILKSNAI
jgi:two-component system, sporulation sensor kinase E